MIQDPKSSLRRDIIRAATSLFGHTHNINKVSLETIAKEAGVSPATIYNYFGTRENLVHEVARELVREMIEKIKALIDSDLPFPQKLAEMLSVKMDFVGNNRETLVKLLNRYKSITPEAVNLSEIADLSDEFFDDAKKQGYIDACLDNRTLTEYFDVLRAGIAAKPELAVRFGESVPLTNDFIRLIFYGLMKKDVGRFDK